MKIKCDNIKCGKVFDKLPNRVARYDHHFCCKDCHTEFQRKYRDCRGCGKSFIAAGRTYCSRKCSNVAKTGRSYTGASTKNVAERVKRLKEELFAKRGEQCERCGYSNIRIINLHHKLPKSKGGNDNHSNLELLCPNCHAEEHYGK